MTRALVVAVLAAFVLAALGATSGPDEVFVTNFPVVQQVAVTVTVGSPIPMTRLETLRAQVTPAGAADVIDWTDAGTLDATGYAFVTLSLGGYVQGRIATTGAVGAVLIPDQPDAAAALHDYSVQQFPLTVVARVQPTDAAIFQSPQTNVRLGFPRYRVYLYNSTPRTSQVALYAYLNNS